MSQDFLLSFVTFLFIISCNVFKCGMKIASIIMTRKGIGHSTNS